MEEPPPLPYFPPRPKWYQTLTGQILALNIAVFAGQIIFDVNAEAFEMKWGLSLAGMKAGHWWQLLTFQFLHANLLHIVCNCLLIAVMGKIVEAFFGKQRFLIIYLFGGVAGALLELYLLSRGNREEYLLGASAGACSLLSAFCTAFPTERLKVLLLFIIPIKMSARTMLWVTIILSVVGMTGIIPGNVAHAAHLGGLLFGILSTKFFLRVRGTP